MRRVIRGLALSTCLALVGLGASVPWAPAQAQNGLSGAYLAARQASGANDFRAAAEYFTKALVRDPSNLLLLESAAIAQVALGRFDSAVPVARRLRESGTPGQVAELVLLADLLNRGDFARVLADQAAGASNGPLVDGLVAGWAHLATGDVAEAMAAFDTVAATQALGPFATYHKALALAMVGDLEGADALLGGADGEGSTRLSRRAVLAHAEILGRLERWEDALALLETAFGADPEPAVARLRGGLQARDLPPLDLIATPREGLAEVFHSVAGVLNGETGDAFVLMYSRAAELLAPDHADAILLSAALLERMGQHDLASETYARVQADDPAFHLAEMGRAEALHETGRTDEAVAVLSALAVSHADLPSVHRALGDMLRRQERWEEAAQAFDAAIGVLPVVDASHWVLYYLRAIAYERSDLWDLAEPDFRKALELQPDQPQVLNYLGYSYLEQGVNYDEALQMIERAVAARPEDGHIVDSLGWAFYRLGRYEEAVEPMERAAELMPLDPVVNDHLGDVYWAVGRRNEARFQWRRALSFAPEEEDATRIRRKLDVGLDVVLEEEGADPIRMANDGGAADGG